MIQDILIIILLWAVYFFIHSLMADNKFKLVVKNWVGRKFIYYRLIYVFISVFGLVGIVYFLATHHSFQILPPIAGVKYGGLVLASWGAIIIKHAIKNYSMRDFLGIAFKEERPEFVNSGLLNYVRHPLYTGTILFTIGFWLYIPNLLNLVTVICIFIYLFIGIKLEERKLVEAFGERYLQFLQSTPMLFPRLKHIKKLITG